MLPDLLYRGLLPFCTFSGWGMSELATYAKCSLWESCLQHLTTWPRNIGLNAWDLMVQELEKSHEAHAQLQRRMSDLDGQQGSATERALEQRLAEAQRLAVGLQDQIERLQQVDASCSIIRIISKL